MSFEQDFRRNRSIRPGCGSVQVFRVVCDIRNKATGALQRLLQHGGLVHWSGVHAGILDGDSEEVNYDREAIAEEIGRRTRGIT
jgi:hypothetical protein